MAQIPREQLDQLVAAIGQNDYLRRVVAEVERLHRVVFHDNARADWDLVRRSAEQIVIAEVVHRHRGHHDGVYFALRHLEEGGHSWDAAVAELAAGIHSYYTTPLGMVMRQDLFGKDTVFITPDALAWAAQLRGQGRVDSGGRS